MTSQKWWIDSIFNMIYYTVLYCTTIRSKVPKLSHWKVRATLSWPRSRTQWSKSSTLGSFSKLSTEKFRPNDSFHKSMLKRLEPILWVEFQRIHNRLKMAATHQVLSIPGDKWRDYDILTWRSWTSFTTLFGNNHVPFVNCRCFADRHNNPSAFLFFIISSVSFVILSLLLFPYYKAQFWKSRYSAL